MKRDSRWEVDDALRVLRRDPELRAVIRRVGPVEIPARRPYFWMLCRALLSQQVSGAAARTITARFRALYPAERHPTPASVARTTPARLRKAGVSRQKARYLRELARAFHSGHLRGVAFSRLSDDEILDRLTSVVGVGRWTAEMFLMFCVRRRDVFPVDDLGIRKGMERLFRVEGVPAMVERAEPWRPYRTVASVYIWRGH